MAAMRFPSVSATYRVPSADKAQAARADDQRREISPLGRVRPDYGPHQLLRGPILSIDQNDAHDRAAIRAPNKLAFFRKLEALMGIVLPADSTEIFGTGSSFRPGTLRCNRVSLQLRKISQASARPDPPDAFASRFSPAGQQKGQVGPLPRVSWNCPFLSCMARVLRSQELCPCRPERFDSSPRSA